MTPALPHICCHTRIWSFYVEGLNINRVVSKNWGVLGLRSLDLEGLADPLETLLVLLPCQFWLYCVNSIPIDRKVPPKWGVMGSRSLSSLFWFKIILKVLELSPTEVIH